MLIEEPHHDRQPGTHALGVEGDLDVGGIVVGGCDQRLRAPDPSLLEERLVPGVALNDGDAVGLCRVQPLGPCLARHDDHALAEPA